MANKTLYFLIICNFTKLQDRMKTFAATAHCAMD